MGETESLEARCESRIWSHQPAGVLELPQAEPTSWGGSIQAEIKALGLRPELGWPQSAAAPYLKAAIVMMAKDEDDIIGANLSWLYFIGIRRMVVIDNDSRDGTARALAALRERFPDLELVTVVDPIVRYMQSEKTTGLYRLALSLWPDVRWVFPVDADEFLIPLRGLAVLEAVAPRIDALTIPKSIHFRNRRDQGPDRETFFTRMTYCSPVFEVPPKIALRRNPYATIEQGNHKMALLTRPVVYDGALKHGFYYREYPVRSFDHFLRKTRNGGRAIQAAEAFLGHGVGGGHWLESYALLQQGDEKALMDRYEQSWLIDPPERFLSQAFTGVDS